MMRSEDDAEDEEDAQLKSTLEDEEGEGASPAEAAASLPQPPVASLPSSTPARRVSALGESSIGRSSRWSPTRSLLATGAGSSSASIR